jgi:very-short-patch-repair endonuclease
MQQQSRTVEQVMARMGSRAHGIVARAELLRAEITPEQIRQRLRKGSLIQEFPGVYRVGHRASSVEARYVAAVKACGEGAVLSGVAAAHVWGLIRGDPPMPEVTTRTERRIKGIRTHRTRNGVPARVWKAIPITTVPQTLVDLAATLPPYMLARACHEADVKYGLKPEQVYALMRHNTPGAATLMRVLSGDTKVTLSRLERRFLQLLRAHDLPLPETNQPAGSKRVDCRWPDHHLTVELDSYTFHRTRYAWEQDRRREREAYARGDSIRRYTHGDVLHDPATVVAELQALLAA